jgi:hypothetical protein
MRSVLSSTTEAETGALFHNAKDAALFRITLLELGHTQGPTSIQTDNACASGINNDTVKQRRSKAMDMRFYWIKDRVAEDQYVVHWRKGSDNLADYFALSLMWQKSVLLLGIFLVFRELLVVGPYCVVNLI